ncbi:MAG: hypothetical protein ABW292_09100 [Vicinamibacterales bacterium]
MAWGSAGILRQLTLLTVILAAFLCVGMWAHQSDAYRRLVVVPASIAIAATGAFWTVQRLSPTRRPAHRPKLRLQNWDLANGQGPPNDRPVRRRRSAR